MLNRTTVLSLACALLVAPTSIAVVPQQAIAAGVIAPEQEAGRSLAQASFAALAVSMVRMERLVAIGQLCGSLNEETAALIVERASAEVLEARRDLADGDHTWADIYLEGLRAGAFQSAQLYDVADEQSCRRFAEPGGTLTKLLTWTDEPQQVSPGIIASPRTTP
ncbi:hypothetical protein ACBY01_15715 [Sphingomonas sp. ac-8]|uniref:hypothetical protein n=1 Tax=Sphingomonas sp. ac-8 TaxID=3242977 RepID=UPI003A80AA46